MGKIASDFYQKLKPVEPMEISFRAEELLRMASMEVQEEFAGWMDEDEELSGYIPGEVLFCGASDDARRDRICHSERHQHGH